MNSNYHMSKIIVNERIRAQQQAAAAHRLARQAAGQKPGTPGVHQRVAAQIVTVARDIFAAIEFGVGLVRDAFAVRTAVR